MFFFGFWGYSKGAEDVIIPKFLLVLVGVAIKRFTQAKMFNIRSLKALLHREISSSERFPNQQITA